MTLSRTLAALLEERLGLSPESMGVETITRAVQRHMRALGESEEERYVERIRTSAEGWEALTEEVVVPETWFFRNPEAFSYLVRVIGEERPSRRPRGAFRILSVPCASGEEPYSIAMALLDGGIPRERFEIDAMDVSARAIEKATAGIYGRESFRGSGDDSYRSRHFEADGDQWRLRADVKETVRFLCGNVLMPGILDKRAPYDVIFCRNLLIYFTEQARRRTVKRLEKLLGPKGILFTGHVETCIFMDQGFTKVAEPSAFACVKASAAPGEAPHPPRPVVARPGRVPPRRDKIEPPAVASPGGGMAGVRPPGSLLVPGQAGGTMATFAACEASPEVWKALDAPAEDPAAVIERARNLADGGLLGEALAECEKVVAKDALFVPAHFLMGLVHEAMGLADKAVACFRKVLYLAPDHGEALEHMALLAEGRGDAGEAERLRRRARRNHGGTEQ